MPDSLLGRAFDAQVTTDVTVYTNSQVTLNINLYLQYSVIHFYV